MSKKEGKSTKAGRNTRKPSNIRRNQTRPDLRRKARNVLRSGGPAALAEWAAQRKKRGENAILINRITSGLRS